MLLAIKALVLTLNLAAGVSLWAWLGGRAAGFAVIGVGLGVVVSFIPLMGLVGFVFMVVFDGLTSWFWNHGMGEAFDGDVAWPAALYINALIGAGALPLLSLAAFFSGGMPHSWSQWLGYAGALGAWALVCPLLVLKLHRLGYL